MIWINLYFSGTTVSSTLWNDVSPKLPYVGIAISLGLLKTYPQQLGNEIIYSRELRALHGRRDHVEKYKRIRNRVTTMLRNGKKRFFQNLNPHNNKQFWKAMKYLRKQTSSIPNLSYNNVVSSMDQEKANMLNDYFSKCFNRSQPSLQTTDCLNYPLADDCPDEILCTESEVTELLMTLDIAKASGPDGISVRMLRETAEHISPSLTKILIYPSRLDHFLHSGKSQTLFPSLKPMTIVIHLTTGPYLFYLSWANYWRNMFTTLLPSMCPQTHSLPMYSGESLP